MLVGPSVRVRNMGDSNKLSAWISGEELPKSRSASMPGLFSLLDPPAEPRPEPSVAPARPHPLKGLLDPQWLPTSEGIQVQAESAPLARWLEASSPAAGTGAPTAASRLSPWLAVGSLLLKELENGLYKLLSLNQSRRDALAQYLESLAGMSRTDARDAREGREGRETTEPLARWIDGPRSPAQNAALQAYFEETVILTLAQALILKAWSDRGVRPFQEKDLSEPQWKLGIALKPYLPPDREAWQLVRQNIYSWYKPSAEAQAEIWRVLQTIRFTDEGPEVLMQWLGPLRRSTCARERTPGYDHRFYSALWEPLLARLPAFATSPSGYAGSANGLSRSGPEFRRMPIAFTPTLRDGELMRAVRAPVQWVALESDLFSLLCAELTQIWWGPLAPPLWALGLGLEAHSREQLGLALHSAKPSLHSRLAEMEACELALVLEEQAVRVSSRTGAAARFKEQLDALPYFKRLRSGQTTLGELQACVSLSKLRPGGVLVWAREEPLTSSAGLGALGFLLERGTLLAEWDLSALEHTLPSARSVFPQYLYVWQREPELTRRADHHPMRVRAEGLIRSHIELQSLLEDIYSSAHAAPASVTADGESAGQAVHHSVRGAVRIQRMPSPTPQREWLDHWPDPASQATLAQIDRIRAHSVALAQVATIRPTPDMVLDPVTHKRSWKLGGSFQGLWIEALHTSEGRRLAVRDLPAKDEPVSSAGWLVLLSDQYWGAALAQYLGSPGVRAWLDHHATRRGERWVLTDGLVRSIPIPQLLLEALRAPGSSDAARPASPLPGDWERLAAEVAVQPGRVAQAVQALTQRGKGDGPAAAAAREESDWIRANLFVRASRAIETLHRTQGRLLAMVSPEGRIRWKDLLAILPKAECVGVTLHPAVRLTGSLPLHVPIARWERVQRPEAGLLFVTELGPHQTISTSSRLLLDMLVDQLDGIVHPTWNELVQYLRLPRRLEIAEATATDLLRSHGEQRRKLAELEALLAACAWG